jgi:hypothetical protein
MGWPPTLNSILDPLPLLAAMSGPSLDNDDFFRDLDPPPPEGWDWKRIQAVPLGSEEWNALPEAQKFEIMAYRQARQARWAEIRGADDAAAARAYSLLLRREVDLTIHPPSTSQAERKAARRAEKARGFLTPEELAVVQRYDLPQEQVGTPLFEVAEVMHRRNCDYWGFWVFRVCGYASPAARERWDEFDTRFRTMIGDRLGRLVMDGMVNAGLRKEDDGFEERFCAMYKERLEQGVVPRWATLVKEKEVMEGMGASDVREIFREWLKSEKEVADGTLAEEDAPPDKIPPGVDRDLCLMVDEGVVSSLLDQREGKRPYIIGVLSGLDLDYDEDEDEDEDDDEVPEDPDEVVQFKIALESVVDLWRQIQVQDVEELVPPEGKIYVSPGVFVDDD